ncbi:MAG: ral nucleoside transport system permease protein [Pseudonocardiales bacterium]|jgi:simple sugar transport system permease protein|nr:ral nucleoside transport system permease protein [Pseudonocardiales bacterium]
MNGIEQSLIGGIDGGTAILLPAIGELIGERAGIVNLGTEGCMLAGALAAFAATAVTHSTALGLGAGLLAGGVCGLGHAVMTVRRKADQLASGLVIWFLALGITSVFGTSYIGRVINPLPVLKVPGLSAIPWVGPIFFKHDLLVYVGYVLVGIVWFVFYRTRVGLVLRATGERSEVVAAAGGRPQLVQICAVTIGAGLAGVGGAQLSIGYVGNWFNDMTSGYGFVAVAVVLFAAWRPVRVMGGAYLFGIALAAASVLQAHNVSVNQYLLDSLPYLITLIALVTLARRGSSDTPEGLARALAHTT